METRGPLLLVDGTLFHGRYRVRRNLRAGGMGAVYEVLDESTRRRRALKVMLATLAGDADLRARFAREATITSELRSDHLVDVLDAGVDEETGAPFLVMELLEGEEVGEMLARRGSLPGAETVDLLRQAARAVDLAHEADIVHRDLKPSNLFVARIAGGGARLKVLDFGIAKLIAASMTSAAPTRSVGTPLYMAPEQARGEGTIDGRADLYSLAQIAFALLTGKPYFEPESRTGDGVFPVLLAVTRGIDDPASARAEKAGSPPLPPGFDAWFARAAALDPASRFDTAAEMIESLAETLSLREGEPPSPVRQSSHIVRGSRGRVRIGVAALAIGLVAAFFVWATTKRGASSAGAPPPPAESMTTRVENDPRTNAVLSTSVAPGAVTLAPGASGVASSTASVFAGAPPAGPGGATASSSAAPPASARAPGAKPAVTRAGERPPEEMW